MFFLAQWIIALIGFVLHVFLDRSPQKRTGHRVIELALLWCMVFFGAWSIVSGLGHIGPTSNALAEQIGYTQSMFQWEVGWADIALGVLGVGCAWKSRRDGWLTAAVVALVIMYWGDAIGHVMEIVAHDNYAPSNVWATPSDIIQPLLAVVLLILYRRSAAREAPADTSSI